MDGVPYSSDEVDRLVLVYFVDEMVTFFVESHLSETPDSLADSSLAHVATIQFEDVLDSLTVSFLISHARVPGRCLYIPGKVSTPTCWLLSVRFRG